MKIYTHCAKCNKQKKPTKHQVCVSCSHLGQVAWNKGLLGFSKGRKVSLETRERIGLAQRGNKNHNWKGGKTPKFLKHSYKDAMWREEVIKRDNSTCVICGKFCYFPITHHVNHKIAFPQLKYDVNNGKTLCYDCHMIIHKKVSYYRIKSGELSENLNEKTLSQAWEEISAKVQRILDETKELYSMSVIPARAPGAKAKIYAELAGDCKR